MATPTPDGILLENPVNLLDVVYLENAIHTANELVQDNVNYWMGKYSECVMLLNNIKGLLALYETGDIHKTLCDILDTIPDASDPPPAPQLFLHIDSPTGKGCKPRKPKNPATPVDIYSIVRTQYKRENPMGASACVVPRVPDTTLGLQLQNLESKIRECQNIVTELENMTLYNAANFGNWLEVAFSTYQREKDMLKAVWPSFELWVESRCGITVKWARELRKFYKLISEYPQLLFCRLSLSFFRKNAKGIVSYFSCEPEVALRWKHPFTCSCTHCGP